MRRAVAGSLRSKELCRRVHIAQSPTASIPLSMDVSDLIKDIPQVSGDGPFPKGVLLFVSGI